MTERQSRPAVPAAQRISRRDVEVLDFIARFGFVSRMSLMKRWGEDRRQVVERTLRLRRLGLIEIHAGAWDGDTLHSPTGTGALLCDRLEPLASRAEHTEHLAVLAELAACEERLGKRVLSAHELGVMQTSEAAALCASLPDGGLRRPDMVVLGSRVRPEAVEVELTPRGTGELERLMCAWAAALAAGRAGAVTWRCGGAALARAEAAAQACASGSLAVRGLWR